MAQKRTIVRSQAAQAMSGTICSLVAAKRWDLARAWHDVEGLQSTLMTLVSSRSVTEREERP
jgi:hypothetical protein